MESSEGHGELTRDRRKTRKGTHSCWECKRRKERCTFLHKDSTCISCKKRGTSCVSQEFPIGLASRISRASSVTQIQRIELLLQQLLSRLDADPKESRPELRAEDMGYDSLVQHAPDVYSNRQKSSSTEIASVAQSTQRNHEDSRSQYQSMSQMLHSAMPSHRDTEVICRVTKRYHLGDILLCAYDEPTTDNNQLIAEFMAHPRSTAPPAVLAKRLLRFATHLQQHFKPNLHIEIKELSATLPVLITSYVDAAAHFIQQDQLKDGFESLECIILLAVYECNRGNLRLSWLLVRRAIAMAQMSGLHLDNNRQHNPSASNLQSQLHPGKLWMRINYWDRLSSLLLGLPNAVDNSRMPSDSAIAAEPSVAHLERMHCTILADIIQRNQVGLPPQDFHTTKILDLELQKMTAVMPATWWTLPILNSHHMSATDLQSAMRRVTLQMLHANLLLQVHLPHLLQFSHGRDHELSRIACMSSARDVLTRYLMCRSFHHEDMICRISGFIAFNAAVTLVLGYIGRNHECCMTGVWPVHYRRSDLGIVQQVEEAILQEDHTSDDMQNSQMSAILRQLIRMEGMATNGGRMIIKHIQHIDRAIESESMEDAINIQVPYFGIVHVAHEKAYNKSQYVEPSVDLDHTHGNDAPPIAETTISQAVDASLVTKIQGESLAARQMDTLDSFETMPSFFANVNDWALQGLETTLFSNLLGQSGTDWTAEHRPSGARIGNSNAFSSS